MKRQCIDISQMQNNIMALENLIFQISTPVNLNKIDPELSSYDYEYDIKVRGADSALICMLSELMLLYGRESMCWDTLVEIENCLSSPEFYRRMIFTGRCNLTENFIRKFNASLTKEIDFLQVHLKAEDYKKVLRSISNHSLPLTRKKFFEEINKRFHQMPRIKNQ